MTKSAVQRFTDRLFGIILILGKPKSRGTLRLRPGEAAMEIWRYLSAQITRSRRLRFRLPMKRLDTRWRLTEFGPIQTMSMGRSILQAKSVGENRQTRLATSRVFLA
jgi:hypothetical protein